MALITSEVSVEDDVRISGQWDRPTWLQRVRKFRPGPLHASALVSAVVAFKAFQMSYAALHNLAIRNLVAPELAANVPIAIDGLMVGSVIATASFRKGGLGWWYATGLFVLSTLVSVAGNIEYAREIGGDKVSVAIYAGMPLSMMFAVHLTLILWNRGHRGKKPAEAAAVEFAVEPENVDTAMPEMFEMAEYSGESAQYTNGHDHYAAPGPQLTVPRTESNGRIETNGTNGTNGHRGLIRLGERG